VGDGSRTAEPTPEIVSANTKILFTGTTFWGRRTNKKARASELGVKYPFSNLDSLNRDDYDAWIGGLECPVTDNGHDDYAEEKLFEFNCAPDYLPEASKYFTAFLLGNNHTDNQGPEGFAKTREYLQANNIQYFGSYDYADGENNCGIVVLPINAILENGETESHQMPFGFCSAHGVFGIPVEAARANMEKYAGVVPTFAMPHMGAEYKASADTLRTNLYHEMIDRGVEAVIADHPHWTQNAESYKGRLIVYSMGNFMFDQSELETARSAAIEADITIDGKGVDFEAWDKLAEQCLVLNGDCYDEIAASGLSKLSIGLKYDYHGTTTDRQTLIPRAANEAENTAIGQRLNWAALPAELKK
jgi:poly-gamma-glutamate synthesis protein (capsule biosynthesis protein)